MRFFYMRSKKTQLAFMVFILLTSSPFSVAEKLESISMIADTAINHSLPIEHWINPNGVRVYYVNAPSLPMLDVKIVFNAGSARDGKKPGTALITNAMLDEGADSLTADMIADQFDSIGAQFNSQSVRDMAFVELRTLSDEKTLSNAIPMMSKIIQSPSFPQSSLTRIKNQLLSSLTKQQQVPQAIIKKGFFSTIYGNHPYGSPVDGNQSSIAAITRQDVQKLYDRFYVGNNVIMVLVGNINRKTAERIGQELTGALPAGAAAPVLPAVMELTTSHNKHIEFDSTQTHILIGAPIITRHDPNYAALYVANYIFGGSGFGSILMEEIREKRGLAYAAHSDLIAMNALGPFMINLQTRNDQAEEALSVTQQALTSFIKKGPSEDQLAKAKRQIAGEFPLSVADNASIADHLASIGFYNLPINYYDTFLKQIDALTTSDITTALQKHIKSDQLVTITIGNRSESEK